MGLHHFRNVLGGGRGVVGKIKALVCPLYMFAIGKDLGLFETFFARTILQHDIFSTTGYKK